MGRKKGYKMTWRIGGKTYRLASVTLFGGLADKMKKQWRKKGYYARSKVVTDLGGLRQIGVYIRKK